MPDIPQSSEQMQGATTSQGGTNVVAKLQPESHFYIGGGFTQLPGQAFGVVDIDKFRTTASVTLSGNNNLYTLCSGLVGVLPQIGDANRVNLILKPYRQPVKGLNIKYIIYRGLDRGEFFTNNPDGPGEIIAGGIDSGSEFVQYLWQQFNKFYGEEDSDDSPPQFQSELIGFLPEADIDNNQLLDKYFYKITSFIEDEVTEAEGNYELPMVPRGMQLGTFNNDIGIDIVLNDGDYYIENDTNPFKLNLAYARAPFYQLDASSIDGSTDAGAYEIKRLKENATKFIDVAAFYGLHANGTGKLYVEANETPLATKAEIQFLLQNFTSNNNFYLYIQANRQRSYNFYNNYNYAEGVTTNLKIGFAEDNLSEGTFETLGWPVHVVDQSQSATTDETTVVFQLNTDNHDGAALFIQLGELTTPHEENFVRQDNLLQKQLEDGSVDTNYTKVIILSSSKVSNATIPAFAQLVYEGKRLTVTDTANPDLKYVLKDIDDMFGLIDAQSAFALGEGQHSTIICEPLQIVNFPDTQGVIRYQKIEDRVKTSLENVYFKRITYESLLQQSTEGNITSIDKGLTSIDKKSGNFKDYRGIFKDDYYSIKSPYTISLEFFADGSSVVNGLLIDISSSFIPTKKILGIGFNENERIRMILNNNNTISNPKLYLREIDADSDSILISKLSYKKYELGIIGEIQNGKLVIFMPDEEVVVYTLDDFIFASNEYAKHVEEDFSKLLFTTLKA